MKCPHCQAENRDGATGSMQAQEFLLLRLEDDILQIGNDAVFGFELFGYLLPLDSHGDIP